MSETRDFWDPALDEDPRAAGRALVGRHDAIERHPDNQLARNVALLSARLYENAPITSLRMFGSGSVSTVSANKTTATFIGERSTHNHLRAVVQTAQSIITRNRVRPVFLSRGGDWRQRRRVAKLNKIADGIFSENRTYDLAQQIFIDGAAVNIGVIHVLDNSRSVKHERLFPTELMVDPGEAEGGWDCVRTPGRRRPMDADAVISAFCDGDADKTQAVKDAAKRAGGRSNEVIVDEAWHRDSGSGDGRHSIAVAGYEIHREKWPHAWVPLVPWVWEPGLLGIYGRSIAEQCTRAQVIVNANVSRIDRSLSMSSVPRAKMRANAQGQAIPTSKIDNKIGLLIKTLPGQDIEDFPWKSNTEELQARTDWHIRSMYEVIGVSQPAAAAVSALGPNVSGAALRAEVQMGSNRLAPHQGRWNHLFVDLAQISVMVAKRLYSRTKGRRQLVFTIPGKTFASTVDWKDVSDLNETDFIVDCEEMSKLPTDPAGLVQTAVDLVQAKIWTPVRGAKAIRTLDVEEPQSLQESTEEHLDMVFDRIIENGKGEPPDELDDLELGIELCGQYALRAMCDGVPDARVELLRDWIDDATKMVAARKAKLAPPPAPPMPALPGMPASGDLTAATPPPAPVAAPI